MSQVEKLYESLKGIQEPKGYSFSRDRQRVDELLEALLKNRERYGYMVCPCRLASGERQKDADIICPCAYREADVKEFGTPRAMLEPRLPVLRYRPRRSAMSRLREHVGGSWHLLRTALGVTHGTPGPAPDARLAAEQP